MEKALTYQDIINCMIKQLQTARDYTFDPHYVLDKNIDILNYAPTDIKYGIGNVILELLKAQNISFDEYEHNLTFIGLGSSSVVFQIDEYIFKMGHFRFNEKIPNHKRVLQPLIRCSFKFPGCPIYIEVQNLVDRNWYKNMSQQESSEIVDKIYNELENSGINWWDNKSRNIGKLLKPNKANLIMGYTYANGKWLPDERIENSFLGIVGNNNEILPAGEYVILDTDSLELINYSSIEEYEKKINNDCER